MLKAKNMNVIKYIKKNFDSLPKSSFDGLKVVIFKEIRNTNEGWGHHSYEGVGVDESGQVVWCFSSGCSCNGTVTVEHRCIEKDLKVLIVDEYICEIDHKDIDFAAITVDFSTY